MTNQQPTPKAVIELMTQCLGAVEQVYSTTGRMPYLVDLDHPDLVEILALIIRTGGTDHEAAMAIVAGLRSGVPHG